MKLQSFYQTHRKTIKLAIFLALLLAFFIALDNYEPLDEEFGTYMMLVAVLKKGTIYSLIAVSMNLLNGFTGLFSLGQAGFMLLGAYTYALLSIPVEKRVQVFYAYEGGFIQTQLPWIVSLILAGLVAALFAFLIGLPVLKLKSDYLAIATLGFAEIVRSIIVYPEFGIVTNGSFPIRFYTYFTKVTPYVLICGVSILIIVLLIRSTYGRAMKAIRDDEIAAEAMGINLARHKMISFTVSSFFAGVGGALLAMYQTSITASPFTSSLTYEILLIVVIGGIGSVTGSIFASFLYIASNEWWLRNLDSGEFLGIYLPDLFKSGFRKVVFAVIIMIIVLFFRKGIMGDRELDMDRFTSFFIKGIPNFFVKKIPYFFTKALPQFFTKTIPSIGKAILKFFTKTIPSIFKKKEEE